MPRRAKGGLSRRRFYPWQPQSVPIAGTAAGASKVQVLLDGASFNGTPNSSGDWTVNVDAGLGAHTAQVTALHNDGVHTASATRHFSVSNFTPEKATNTYDGVGRLVQRTWTGDPNGTPFIARTQTFTWDPFGNLLRVTQRSPGGDGYDWSAVYDPLGRRILTSTQTIKANLPFGSPVGTGSSYDPLAEFLEVAVTVGGQRALKVHGPDSSGVYGGAQGVGGLESVVVGGTTTPVSDDIFGNIRATLGTAGFTNLTVQVGAYGPRPGSVAAPLNTASDLIQTLAWRGRRQDTVTGLYCLGARYYEPGSGRFISPDPLGHASDMALYSFAGGDPINKFDPTGRVVSAFWSGLTDPDDNTYEVGTRNAELKNAAKMAGAKTNTALTAFGNAAASVATGFATMGMVSDVQPFTVTPGDIDRGYEAMYQIQKFGMDVAVMLSSGGIGGAGRVGSTLIRAESAIVRAETAAVQMSESAVIRARVLANIEANGSKTVGNGFLDATTRWAAQDATLASESAGAAKWTKAEFDGVRVYQRNDLINPSLIDARGRSNLERMQAGLAPIGSDGKSINLHHTIQTSDSPLVELNATFHQQNSSVLHIYPSSTPSNIDRNAFNKFRAEYWKNRAGDFSSP